jgi:tetratricopeptide (TPR) repeat protein
MAKDNGIVQNNFAWFLATCPAAKYRDPPRAVELAKKAVELMPKAGSHWNTLGVSHYRAGDWKAAMAALDKSREFRKGGDAYDWLFLAMAHRKLGQTKEARKWYEQAIEWLQKNKEAIEKDRTLADELGRFRREADEVLDLGKK